MTFHVGMKVVCITDDWDRPHPDAPVPAKNGIYTIAGVHDQADGCFLSLDEISCPAITINGKGYGRITFESKAFRPLVETSISIFTAMLTPKKVTEPV